MTPFGRIWFLSQSTLALGVWTGPNQDRGWSAPHPKTNARCRLSCFGCDDHGTAASKLAGRFLFVVIGTLLQCWQFAGKVEVFFKGGKSL